MEKISFMILVSMLLTTLLAQNSKSGLPLNKPRNLEEKPSETILLGFDNYTTDISNGYKNYTIYFKTYFLFKNWNYTIYPFTKLNNLTIESVIIDTNKNQFYTKFNCINHAAEDIRDFTESGDINTYYLVRYECNSGTIKEGIPKIINFTTDFSEIYINGSDKHIVSSSVEVFKRDLINLKNKTMFLLEYNYVNEDDDYYRTEIWKNATFVSQSPSSFKIKSQNRIYPSSNFQLLTNSYGIPKKIPCTVERKINTTDDKYYYYMESKGANHLTQTDLNYAVANVTTSKNRIYIIDFTEGANSTILPEKAEFKKKSGGLSTGGIIAIIIPAVIVLLGIGALAFFLSRRAVPPPPMKNIANNTMGVVASSEAVVHQ